MSFDYRAATQAALDAYYSNLSNDKQWTGAAVKSMQAALSAALPIMLRELAVENDQRNSTPVGLTCSSLIRGWADYFDKKRVMDDAT